MTNIRIDNYTGISGHVGNQKLDVVVNLGRRKYLLREDDHPTVPGESPLRAYKIIKDNETKDSVGASIIENPKLLERIGAKFRADLAHEL